MDWISQLNNAIEFMEQNMTEEIDYEQVAKIAHCSLFHFQRMFGYIANVSLAEYIRRRKMSLAAIDLQGGNEKVIDVALKYGYESPTAFNRAFQGIHGIAPSKAKKKGVTIKSYPPISFKLTAKGVIEMEFRIEKKEKIRVLGLAISLSDDMTKAYNEAESLWVKVLYEGSPTDANGSLMDYGTICYELNNVCNSNYNGFFAIEMGRGLAKENVSKFIIAVASDKPETNNLKEYFIPTNTWAAFNGENYFTNEYADAENAISLDSRIYTEWLPTSGYTLAGDIDVSFIHSTKDLENAPFEQWLPIVKS